MGRKKSTWLGMAQEKDKRIKPCKTCRGTGAVADKRSSRQVTKTCPDCRGFGYQ